MKAATAFRGEHAPPTITRRALLLAALLLVAAGALRLWRLDAGWFGVDQARDAAWAESIANGGPWPEAGPAMRNRVRLGATYYFFWAIPALLVDSPLAGYAFAALLGTAAVAGASTLAWVIAGPTAGLAALLWLGFHPAAVIDSRVAWAPAAVPAACALFLWAGRRFLQSPGRARAGVLGFVSGLATQLHLAAAALVPVAAGTLLSRFGSVGRAGLAVAAGACGLALLPMLVAAGHPLPGTASSTTAATSPEVSPYADRLLDFLFLVPRFLAGLTSPYEVLPGAARMWIPIEVVAILAPLAAVGWLASRTRSVREPGTLRLVLATFAATTIVPLALPTVVWCYYLDGRFVAGAVAVGVAVALSGSRWLFAAVGMVAICRSALLAWWVASAASSGWIPANLDYLRVGGPRPQNLSARARLLTLATKQEMAEAVVDTIGAVDRPLRWEVHGVGVEDFDTDNGYFLLRAMRERGLPPASGLDALLLPTRTVPPSWIDGFAGEGRLGSLALFEYAAVLHPERGAVEGCATGPLPPPPEPAPMDYRDGEPRRTSWPCTDPVVRIPFGASPDGISVRVFPRLSGPGGLEILSVDPPTEVFGSGVGFLGRGVLLPRGAGEIRLRLTAPGPTTLDFVELHGRRGESPSAARPSPASGRNGAPPAPGTEDVSGALRVDSGLATSGEG